MMKHITNLWRDQRGFTSVMSTIMLTTIVAIGAIVGLATLRDQLVQEFGDVATALENLDQSFDADGYGSYVDLGPSFPGADVDEAGEAPHGLSASIAP